MRKVISKLPALLSDDLLRHTSLLLPAMMVMHVCNLLFQMAVGRALPADEYSLLATFFGVLAVMQRPMSTLTTAVSHYSSLLQRDGHIGSVRRLLRKWILLTGIPALVLGACAVALNDPLAALWHLDRAAPIVIVGLALPAMFCLPVLNGAGQGLQLFGWYSVSMMVGAVVRLMLGAGFVWFVVPACGWAMFGHAIGMYASAAALVVGLFFTLRRQEPSPVALPSLRLYLMQSFFIQAAYAVLMTADVVLVKHYLPEDTEFAYAATLGRLVVFLPGAIVMAMFPKVASRGGGSLEQNRIFLKSFGLTALCVVAAALVCSLVPGLLAHVLFGITDASPYLRKMVRVMAWVMGVSALLNVVVQFLLAQRRFLPALTLLVAAGFYVLAVGLYHATSWQIVWAASACNTGALLLSLLCIFRGSLLTPTRTTTRRKDLP